MPFTTLIQPPDLVPLLGNETTAVVDCRFSLSDTRWGEAEYEASHVPGAVYAHLDRDLSGVKTGHNGRHPLPAPEAARRRLLPVPQRRGIPHHLIDVVDPPEVYTAARFAQDAADVIRAVQARHCDRRCA